MNKEALRLIELLKTDEKLKARIERLEFGCWVSKKYFYQLCRIIEVVGTHIYTTKGDYHIDAVNIIGQITWIDIKCFLDSENYVFDISILENWGMVSLYKRGGDNVIYIDITPGLEILEQYEEVIKQIADWIEDNVLKNNQK